MGPPAIDDCRLMIDYCSPNHQSSIINHQSLQADRTGRTGIDADPAVHATVGVDLRFTLVHGDRAARALLGAGLAARAFSIVDLSRHSRTLSKNTPNDSGKYGIITDRSVITIQILKNAAEAPRNDQKGPQLRTLYAPLPARFCAKAIRAGSPSTSSVVDQGTVCHPERSVAE